MAPEATSVSARPTLKPSTSVAPSENFFSCKQISSTVMDAGQGISPPAQAKQHDLPGRHLAAIKAPVDLLSMGPLMRVLPLLRHQRRGG